MKNLKQIKKKKEILNTFSKLIISDVSFTYPGTENKVLKSVSLEIKKGESICIVGRNGSGKSTLIKLILGLYTPESGSIKIDDVDIFDVKSNGKFYASAILQDYARYSFSLKENIIFDRNIDDEQVINILKKVDFSEDEINKLPCSINTFMNREYDENGISLSDGQWQRVAVARAFFQNTPIIILDEPTSNLDPISEDNLYNVINENKGNKTVIMVSHRLSGVINSDKIIVVDDGSIAGIGTHKELLLNCPIYKYMFELQSKRYIENNA